MDDQAIKFLTANAALTQDVETEEAPPALRSTLTPGPKNQTLLPAPAHSAKIKQVEVLTHLGKLIWIFTYSDGSWDRETDPTKAQIKSLELFPHGPPQNH